MLFFIFPIFGILTAEWVRRSHFELFYFTHFASMVLFLATLWHAASAWYFILPGLALWAFDHGIRFTKGCVQVDLLSMLPHDKDIGDKQQKSSGGGGEKMTVPTAAADAASEGITELKFTKLPVG